MGSQQRSAAATPPGCANCGTALAGEWCHACGQRRLRDRDRRLPQLLGEFLSTATDLDSRFWRSLRALLFQPGLIASDHIAGRRQRWMAPVSLFLLANVLYFVSPALTDFNLPLHSQLQQPHALWTESLVTERVAERAGTQPGYALADYAREYDAATADVGKLQIIVHVPFLALALLVLFRSRRWYFAEHFVVALTLFTFLLMVVQLVLMPLAALLDLVGSAPASMSLGLKLGFGGLVVAHFALALRRVYQCRWWAAWLAPVVLLAWLLLVNLFFYRSLQFLVSFAVS